MSSVSGHNRPHTKSLRDYFIGAFVTDPYYYLNKFLLSIKIVKMSFSVVNLNQSQPKVILQLGCIRELKR